MRSAASALMMSAVHVRIAGEGALVPRAHRNRATRQGSTPLCATRRAVRLYRARRATPGAPVHATGRGRARPAAFDPAAEDAAEDAHRVGLRQFLKDRIDARFHRTAAQQLRAEGVDGADEGAVQTARRFGETAAARRDRASRARRCSNSWRTRSFILPAAACVKVTATIVSTGVPAAITSTMRSTSAVVLPVPAEASTTQLLVEIAEADAALCSSATSASLSSAFNSACDFSVTRSSS